MYEALDAWDSGLHLHGGVIRFEPFGSDRFDLDGVVASEGSSSAVPAAFVVDHVRLDAV
jgi:hypothetical protein